MSHGLISHSPDLRRLRDEGYDLGVEAGLLVIRDVPYVTPAPGVAYGTLVSELTLDGDATARPSDHVVRFNGETPCDTHGQPLDRIIIGSGLEQLAPGIEVTHTFSSKPADGYEDYFEKITTYVAILESPAQALDPQVTARTFPPVKPADSSSVFAYEDTASSRAGIAHLTPRLEIGKVAIVGLGGTGSYILDLLAKTPVQEIHLFDGDRFHTHNAFRAPGAASIEQLRQRQTKVSYLQERYVNMHVHVVAHEHFIDTDSVDQLRDMAFVFLAIDGGSGKQVIVEHLEDFGVPFIDVGLGVWNNGEQLGGQVRVTTSTPDRRESRRWISFSAGDAVDDYDRNIQIAELNALNAALAVIRWKKWCGFYFDPEQEHQTVYEVDGNRLQNEDHQ